MEDGRTPRSPDRRDCRSTQEPKILVMNLKVRPGPARLTSPTVAAQHLLPEPVVQLEIELQGSFGPNRPTPRDRPVPCHRSRSYLSPLIADGNVVVRAGICPALLHLF